MRKQRNFPKPMDVTYIDTEGKVFHTRFTAPPTIEQILTCNGGQKSVWAIRPVNRTIVTAAGVRQYGYWWAIDLRALEWIELGPEHHDHRSGKLWRRRAVKEPRKAERLEFESYDAALAYIRLMS